MRALNHAEASELRKRAYHRSGFTQASFEPVADRLVRDGFLERQVIPHLRHGKVKVYRATPQGVAALASYDRRAR